MNFPARVCAMGVEQKQIDPGVLQHAEVRTGSEAPVMKTTKPVKKTSSRKAESKQTGNRTEFSPLDALRQAVGKEVMAVAEQAAELAGKSPATYVIEAISRRVTSDMAERDLFPGGGVSLSLPVSKELHAALGSEAAGRGIGVDELARTALANVSKRNVFTIELPEDITETVFHFAESAGVTMETVVTRAVIERMQQGNPAAGSLVISERGRELFRLPLDVAQHATLVSLSGWEEKVLPAGQAAPAPQPGGSAAAAVPLRRDTVHDLVERGERQPKAEGDMEIEIHGLVPDCEFDFLTLLGFLCRVLDEHGAYLAKVVAPELSVEDQAALLEALAYATQWRYHNAKGEFPKELHVTTLPGLAGQRVFPREEFFGWLCHLLCFAEVRKSIDKHFLGAGVPIRSRVEWGEVLAVAESYLRRDGAVPVLAPEGRAAWKAAALLKEVGARAEVAA